MKHEISLTSFVFVNILLSGLANLDEVTTGVQHIIADMFSKDKDVLDRIIDLLVLSYVHTLMYINIICEGLLLHTSWLTVDVPVCERHSLIAEINSLMPVQ